MKNIPCNIDAEKAVLGSLILEKDAYAKISDIISAIDFYDERHAAIFELIEKLYSEGRQIDLITVVNEVKKEGIKDVTSFYIADLTSNIASAANIEEHAAIIVDMALKRRVAKECELIKRECFSPSVTTDEIIDAVASFSDRMLARFNERKDIKPFVDNLSATVEHIKTVQANYNRSEAIGIVPYIPSVRRFVTHFEPGNLVIFAARPSMGKTSYVLINEAFEQAKAGNPVVVFSLEMTARELVMRCIERETNFTKYELEKPFSKEQWREFDGHLSRISDIPYFIDDTPLASFAHIKSKAKLLKKDAGIKLIVIDYLQIMGTNEKLTRDQQLSKITRELKALAKELDVPILLLSQLNRNVENRGGSRKPTLADLRESGAIEQDADIVAFLYRPYYYFKEEDFKNTASVIFAKNRNGATGEAIVWVNDTVSRFAEPALPSDMEFNTNDNETTDDTPF